MNTPSTMQALPEDQTAEETAARVAAHAPKFDLNDIAGMDVNELEALINTLPAEHADLVDTLRRYLKLKVQEEEEKIEIAEERREQIQARTSGKDKDDQLGELIEGVFENVAQARAYEESRREFKEDMKKFDDRANNIIRDFLLGKISYDDAKKGLDQEHSGKWDRMQQQMVTSPDGKKMVRDAKGNWFEVRGTFDKPELVAVTDEDKIRELEKERQRMIKKGIAPVEFKDVLGYITDKKENDNALEQAKLEAQKGIPAEKTAGSEAEAKLPVSSGVRTSNEDVMAMASSDIEDDGVDLGGNRSPTTSVAKAVLADKSNKETSSPREIGSFFNSAVNNVDVATNDQPSVSRQHQVTNNFQMS